MSAPLMQTLGADAGMSWDKGCAGEGILNSSREVHFTLFPTGKLQGKISWQNLSSDTLAFPNGSSRTLGT